MSHVPVPTESAILSEDSLNLSDSNESQSSTLVIRFTRSPDPYPPYQDVSEPIVEKVISIRVDEEDKSFARQDAFEQTTNILSSSGLKTFFRIYNFASLSLK